MIDKREIAPEFLARVAGILFTKVRFQDILENVNASMKGNNARSVCFDGLTSEQIADLMMGDAYFYRSYTKMECTSYARGMIDYVNKTTQWRNRPVTGNPQTLNVFDLLFVLLDDLLQINHKEIECCYENIFSWRLLFRDIGEELPVAAKTALWDHARGMGGLVGSACRTEFDWPYVIPHNNKPLDRILQQGIADHHSHLWGSTPYFHVSWVNIMNDLEDDRFLCNLRELPTVEKVETNPTADSGEILRMRAAWIRLYLCRRLESIYFKTEIDDEHARLFKRMLQIVCDYSDWAELSAFRSSLQSEINGHRNYPTPEHDYAVNIFRLKHSYIQTDYRVLIGERCLYYLLFLDYCRCPEDRMLAREDYALFYAYFLIRTKLRSYMVQVNDLMGFDNFQSIERRKWYFLGDTESERSLVRLAVNEVLAASNMKELEIRISPHPEDLIKLDRIINARNTLSNDGTNDLSMEGRYYYVFHFIKRPENDTDAFCEGINLQCRMESFRGVLYQQAKDIITFRQHNPELACKLKGIDAASQEIECRPELFARVYRLLGDFSISYGGYGENRKKLPELGKTYHVGEDFLDVVDGLRAVDEAVHFLDMGCGDRLGHATVLGIHVESWYETKQRRISLAVQDYLDNLAWFYHALSHLQVPDITRLQGWIEREFEYWFRIVYRNSISEVELNKIMKNARDYYDNYSAEDHGRYQIHHCHFDIRSYYQAWTLRGDDPSCYSEGFFKMPTFSDTLTLDGSFKDNKSFPVNYEFRYIPEYSILNYMYQYNTKVRKVGHQRISVELPEYYVEAVKLVQKEMRFRIARRGISIESNPSSNVLISTFRKYEDHPLLVLYNKGLSVTEEENADCAQMHVSINTDDSGVFCTSLQMEYALMAKAMEGITDAMGNQRFKVNEIHSWIDDVRKMGLEQSFHFKRG